MKKSYRKMVVPAFLLLSALASFSQTTDWSITTDAGKNLITMALSNPSTSLQIEDQIVLQVNSSGSPQSGNVRFRDGISRDLTPGEVTLYWDKFNAKQALLRYFETQGKLVTIPSASISENNYGKMTRVTTTAGKEYFGKLQEISGQTAQFGLLDNGACCGPTIFDKIVVSKIHQIK